MIFQAEQFSSLSQHIVPIEWGYYVVADVLTNRKFQFRSVAVFSDFNRHQLMDPSVMVYHSTDTTGNVLISHYKMAWFKTDEEAHQYIAEIQTSLLAQR